MNILSIETSCDETAVSVVEALGHFPKAKYEILGNALFSQIETHREYGGVFPSMAKREHAMTLVPMLEKALNQADLPPGTHTSLYPEQKEDIKMLLAREHGLADELIAFFERYNSPPIGLIAVTVGPGLEPALWVGVNFAKALSHLWNVPVVAVNHMEGHVLASIFDGNHLSNLNFPALSLLISGGHTELIKLKDWRHYEKIGGTRDDAVGEAFDKVARLLGLPYPGGPEISRLANYAREKGYSADISLPRPMLDSKDLDFSFSGLKTAVRYAVVNKELDESETAAVAREFEDAATDVLLKKTTRAVEEHKAKSLIIGGGVSANQHIRQTFEAFFTREYPDLKLYLPNPKLSTDNSIMIALAGHAREKQAFKPKEVDSLVADGNRSLENE